MDMKLNREFVYVHHNVEGNKLTARLTEDLLRINGRRDCVVTEYVCCVPNDQGTISISCQSVAGLGDLANICSSDDVNGEGPNLRFFVAMQKAIVKFIG